METGKVEVEWVTGSAAEFLGLTKEEEAIVAARLEHARLKEAVVEAAKLWPANYEREELGEKSIDLVLFNATDALIAFEVEHKIGE